MGAVVEWSINMGQRVWKTVEVSLGADGALGCWVADEALKCWCPSGLRHTASKCWHLPHLEHTWLYVEQDYIRVLHWLDCPCRPQCWHQFLSVGKLGGLVIVSLGALARWFLSCLWSFLYVLLAAAVAPPWATVSCLMSLLWSGGQPLKFLLSIILIMLFSSMFWSCSLNMSSLISGFGSPWTRTSMISIAP